MEADMELLKRENDSLQDENSSLRKELEKLKNENIRLVGEIENCHKDMSEQIAVLTAVKVEMRRYEVQLNTLKSENAELKYRFARMENNPIGKILFKLYRNLRELKHRIKG